MKPEKLKDKVIITDHDGDYMDIGITYAEDGSPLLVVFITQHGDLAADPDTCGINLNPDNARTLRDELNKYLDLVMNK